MNLRLADHGDMEQLVNLRMELLREVGNIRVNYDGAALGIATRKYLGDRLNKGFICWVAEEDVHIIGVGGLVLFERPPVNSNLSGLEGYIMNVYVVPWCRGRGIASSLVGGMVDYAKTMGIRRIWLHATDKGKSVYERLGFRLKATEMELTW